MADPKPNSNVLIKSTRADTEVAATEDQNYLALVDRFLALHRAGQARAIQVMHRMGAYVDEFMKEQEENGAKKYGAKTLDKLIEDLQSKGVDCARSSLYHCRKIYTIMKEADIELLANRGYTTSHVKALLPLSDELREKIQCEMVDTASNTVIPLNILELKIRDAQMEVKRADANEATDPASKVQADAAKGPAGQDLFNEGGTDPSQENGYTGADGKAAPGADGNPELKAGEGGKAPAGATAGAKDYSAPPLTAVKAMAKVCDQFVTLVPGVTKSCREVVKIGFDSPKAAENWCQARDTCIDALKGAQQYIDGLLETLAAEKRDGGSESFRDSAQPEKKFKKGKKRR